MRRITSRFWKLFRVLRRREYWRALAFGVAASVEHETIPLRDDFATVVDVGANRGQFAVYALRAFPSARLVCFEPLPDARRRLRRAVGGSRRVSLSELALGAQSAEALLHVSAADDSSSLLPIGSRQSEEFPGTAERTTITVGVSTLNVALPADQLNRPVLLKLDVQGGELAVLEGGSDTLEKVDAVLVEASFVALYTGQPLADAVFEYLRGRGFVCHGGWSMTYSTRGECLQGDFLFARDGFDPLSA